MTDPASMVIVLGAGGHARMLAQFLRHAGHTVIGHVCPEHDAAEVDEWLGTDADLSRLLGKGVLVANGVGSVGRPHARRRAFAAAQLAGAQFVNFVHPAAVIDPAASLGRGGQVLAGAIIQPGSRSGDNVLINSGALIEHDVRIGDHAHVAPRACLCGDVKLGCDVHVGAGAIVMQGLTIGDGAVIGAGAVVTRPVAAGITVVGNPARELEYVGK